MGKIAPLAINRSGELSKYRSIPTLDFIYRGEVLYFPYNEVNSDACV